MFGASVPQWVVEMWRYFSVSLLALVVDASLLLALAQHINYLIAATIGFALGAFVSYGLATRFAFRRRKLAHKVKAEISVYLLVGIVGVGINNGMIYTGVEWFGWDLLQSKFMAAVVTFLFNFALRKLALF